MSGFSKNEAKQLLREVLQPNFRQLICAVESAGTMTLESLCDITSGLEVGYVVVTFDPATDTQTVTYYDTDFNVIVSKPANSEVCKNQDIDVQQIQLCDDVNGDESSIVRFRRFYYVDPSDATLTVIDDWNETLTAKYVVSNVIDCNPNPEYTVITGAAGTWTMPTNVQSVSVTVIQAIDPDNLPTITTDIGTSDIYPGQTISFSATAGEVLRQTLQVDGNHANDIIGISYVAIRA